MLPPGVSVPVGTATVGVAAGVGVPVGNTGPPPLSESLPVLCPSRDRHCRSRCRCWCPSRDRHCRSRCRCWCRCWCPSRDRHCRSRCRCWCPSQSGPPLSESLPVLVSQSVGTATVGVAAGSPPLQPATDGASTAMSAKAKAMLAHVNCNSNSPQLQPSISQACRTPQPGAAQPKAIRTFSLSGGIRKCPVGPRPRKGELSDGAGKRLR